MSIIVIHYHSMRKASRTIIIGGFTLEKRGFEQIEHALFDRVLIHELTFDSRLT